MLGRLSCFAAESFLNVDTFKHANIISEYVRVQARRKSSGCTLRHTVIIEGSPFWNIDGAKINYYVHQRLSFSRLHSVCHGIFLHANPSAGPASSFSWLAYTKSKKGYQAAISIQQHRKMRSTHKHFTMLAGRKLILLKVTIGNAIAGAFVVTRLL